MAIPTAAQVPMTGLKGHSGWTLNRVIFGLPPLLHFNQDLFTFPASVEGLLGKVVECKPKNISSAVPCQTEFLQFIFRILRLANMKNNTEVVLV